MPSAENKMGTMPVNRLLLTISIPMMISMLVQSLYNIVDSIFVSMINENALTAVSLVFPIQNLMMAAASGLGVGFNSLLSRSLGARQEDMVGKSAMNGIFLEIVAYFIFLIVGLTLPEAFLRSQTNDPEIVRYGIQYMSVICICSIGVFMQITFERLLQATGKTMFTMVTQITGAVINIIMDPVLIFGLVGMPRLGVTGAALATIFGQIVAAALALTFNLKNNKEVKFYVKGFRPELSVIGKIFSVGLPSMVMIAIGSVMTYGMNRILIAFTSTATAVFGIYFKLNSFIFMPVFGLNNGMVPIIAYNYGAKRKDRMKKTLRLSLMYAIIIMLIGTLIFHLIPDKLLLLFNASDNMLSIGEPALRIISLSFPLAAFSIIFGSSFQALGIGIYSLITSVLRQLVVLLPVAYLLSKTGNVDNIWWSYPIAELAAVAATAFFMVRINKNIISKMPEPSKSN